MALVEYWWGKGGTLREEHSLEMQRCYAMRRRKGERRREGEWGLSQRRPSYDATQASQAAGHMQSGQHPDACNRHCASFGPGE